MTAIPAEPNLSGFLAPRRRLSSETRRFLVVAGLIFLVNAARMPGTFLYPAFWAEDGAVFFRNSIEIGPLAVVRPIYGMYMVIPRLIAWAATFLPVVWAPFAYAAMAGLVSSLALAVFARDGFRWLVPSDRIRGALCLAFSLVPGMGECFFALCTLTYVLFVGVVFLLLERDESGQWAMGWERMLLLSILWFSVGQGVVLAPLLGWLFFLTRNRNYLLCLTSLAASVALNLAAGNEAGPAVTPSALTLLKVFLDNLFVRTLYLPLVGIHRLGPVLALSNRAFLVLSLVSVGAVGSVLLWAKRLDRQGVGVLALATVSTMTVFPLTALVRYYSLGVLLRPNLIIGGVRYDLWPSVLSLLLAATVLARRHSSRPVHLGSALVLVLIANNVLVEPLFKPPVPFRPFIWEWPRQAKRIEAALAMRSAGRLRETVVVEEIPCRPGLPVFSPIRNLSVGP